MASTPTTVRAAAIQIAPDFERPEGTLERVCGAIDAAAARGAQLAVFPETFVPYYPYFSFVLPPVLQGAPHLRLAERAVVVPGPVTQAVAERARARNMVVVLGVNERDHGSLYNTQLVFDADGTLALKRRKITPTYHERMVWGMGDGAGLKVVDTAVGRVGALACWEHYNPLARYALMAQHEQIHCAQFPGSLVGPIFAEQMEVTIRHHALESGCFVVNATGWLTDEQIRSVTEGEGMVVADLDMALIAKRKRMMDSVGHYARPELLSLAINDRPAQTTVPMHLTQPFASRSPEHDHDDTAAQPAIDDRAPVLRVAAG